MIRFRMMTLLIIPNWLLAPMVKPMPTSRAPWRADDGLVGRDPDRLVAGDGTDDADDGRSGLGAHRPELIDGCDVDGRQIAAARRAWRRTHRG